MRYRSVLWSSLVTVPLVLLAGVRCIGAAEDAQPGKQLYLRYCSACHGAQAKGDGIAGSLMEPHPADLTQLASRYGGEYPLDLIVRSIDGRQALRAHGDAAMPVWGEVLSEEYGAKSKQHPAIERRVQGRILAIADYLRTIQVK